MPFVYLIQPTELINTHRYKVGMSNLTNLSRMKSYKSGTKYLCICECFDPYKLEQIILQEFRKRFTLIAGNEYFHITLPEGELVSLFMHLVITHKYPSISSPPHSPPLIKPRSTFPNDKKKEWMQKFAYSV